ncbi:MAG TPA: cytochrome c maturation protein CcmE [Acidimicrobiales bacterium]|nr:cytochrome c maturation protein CcmE [Acidimicrobiales bacterium]
MKIFVAIALIAGAIAFLLVKGLGDATTYYRTADEAVSEPEGKRFRLEGVVVSGSVDEGEGAFDFTVEANCERVDVHHTGSEPELFQEGIPVVLEGEWGAGKRVYESDRIILRHTEEYTDDPERQRAAAEEACDR